MPPVQLYVLRGQDTLDNSPNLVPFLYSELNFSILNMIIRESSPQM